MTRQSFILREDFPEGGSYLQYYPTTVSASSSAASATYLRADDLQIAALSSILGGFYQFEGYASDYREVTLEWNAPLQEPGPDPAPYEVLIVYSRTGHPATIPEGQVLVRTRNVSELVHKNIEDTWAYYTMFIRVLSDSDDDYYEPVGYLSVLLPTKYDSVEAMYSRIPTWYQDLDQKNGGDLHTFLEIFGWDVDYIRTVLDYMITMKDPQIAEAETLSNLAQDLGVDLMAHELGADRLRKLIDNIGVIRRSKGTLNSIQEELSAVTGSNVVIDTINKEIKVYSQRCNLVKDPKFVNGVQTGLDGGSPSTDSNLSFDVSPGDDPSVGWNETTDEWDDYTGELQDNGYVDGYLFDGGLPSSVGPDLIEGTTQKWVGYIDPESGEYKVLETLGADIPVIAGDTFYFSVQASGIGKPVQESIVSVNLYTAGGVSEGDLIVSDTHYHEINGIRYWGLTIPDTITDYTYATLSIVFDHTPEGHYSEIFYEDFTNVLFERNFLGEYFDGNTRLGGWIVDNMNSISDFRWRNPGNPNQSLEDASFSVYSANYQKTKAVVQRLLPSVLPITELVSSGTVYSNRLITDNMKYIVTYDNIPGF